MRNKIFHTHIARKWLSLNQNIRFFWTYNPHRQTQDHQNKKPFCVTGMTGWEMCSLYISRNSFVMIPVFDFSILCHVRLFHFAYCVVLFVYFFFSLSLVSNLFRTGTVVFVGVKFVNKFAAVALTCVICSIIAVYVGIFDNINGNEKLKYVNTNYTYMFILPPPFTPCTPLTLGARTRARSHLICRRWLCGIYYKHCFESEWVSGTLRTITTTAAIEIKYSAETLNWQTNNETRKFREYF